MTRPGRKIAIVLAGLIIVTAAIVYWPPWQTTTQQQQQKGKGGFRKKGGSSTAQTEAVPVLSIDARTADVPVYLDGVGTARALNTVTVKPQVDGKLISVSFTEGQEVPKGFVLAKIDPTTYQAAYDQVVAKKAQDAALLANQKLDLERYTRLAASNAVNKQQLDTQRALVAQTEALVNFDQAQIDNARAILSYTDITAPIAGRTGIRQIDEGNIVRASDPNGLVVITQIRPITVFFNLPQQELAEINKGLAEGPLPVQAMAPDNRGIVDSGKVTVIDNQVDQTTGTVRLRAEFPNADLQLWPGQFVNVRLLIDTLRQVVVVPTAAVQRGPNGTFVYIIKDDNKVSVRPVSITQQDDQRAVIASGLQRGVHVVTTGFGRLAEGTLVETSSAEAAGQVSTGEGKDAVVGRGKRGERGKGEAKQSSGGSASTPP
jgi:multidrug efflux system membrane fusion protein